MATNIQRKKSEEMKKESFFYETLSILSPSFSDRILSTYLLM